MTTQPWPPPPDLPSLKELVSTADVEGFIADGAPPDEYDSEAELLHVELENLTTADLTTARILPILESIWEQNFAGAPADAAHRREALQTLAASISRFFGPEAQPAVRDQSQVRNQPSSQSE